MFKFFKKSTPSISTDHLPEINDSFVNEPKPNQEFIFSIKVENKHKRTSRMTKAEQKRFFAKKGKVLALTQKKNPDTGKYYTKQQIADKLGLTHRQVRRYVENEAKNAK